MWRLIIIYVHPRRMVAFRKIIKIIRNTTVFTLPTKFVFGHTHTTKNKQKKKVWCHVPEELSFVAPHFTRSHKFFAEMRSEAPYDTDHFSARRDPRNIF